MQTCRHWGDKMLNDGKHFGYYYFANYTSIEFDILIPKLSLLIVYGFERISKSIYEILEGINSCAFFCRQCGSLSSWRKVSLDIDMFTQG